MQNQAAPSLLSYMLKLGLPEHICCLAAKDSKAPLTQQDLNTITPIILLGWLCNQPSDAIPYQQLLQTLPLHKRFCITILIAHALRHNVKLSGFQGRFNTGPAYLKALAQCYTARCNNQPLTATQRLLLIAIRQQYDNGHYQLRYVDTRLFAMTSPETASKLRKYLMLLLKSTAPTALIKYFFFALQYHSCPAFTRELFLTLCQLKTPTDRRRQLLKHFIIYGYLDKLRQSHQQEDNPLVMASILNNTDMFEWIVRAFKEFGWPILPHLKPLRQSGAMPKNIQDTLNQLMPLIQSAGPCDKQPVTVPAPKDAGAVSQPPQNIQPATRLEPTSDDDATVYSDSMTDARPTSKPSSPQAQTSKAECELQADMQIEASATPATPNPALAATVSSKHVQETQPENVTDCPPSAQSAVVDFDASVELLSLFVSQAKSRAPKRKAEKPPKRNRTPSPRKRPKGSTKTCPKLRNKPRACKV